VASVPGVKQLANRLEPHEQADVPGLQGGRLRRARGIDVMQANWAPATRMLVGGGGAILALSGLTRRLPGRPLLIATGIALLARAATNVEAKRLLGLSGRRGIHFTRTLHIAAPVEEVFGFWRDFENFPRFMRNVRSVRRNADDSWHWEVAGPVGTTVQWDSRVTQLVPDQLIAWAATGGALVRHAGRVRFQREDPGTRVQVEMRYSPTAGAAGHVVASLFGADPRTEIDEDLMRLKSYLETGVPARDAAGAPF
jgi:uncharacterized membrane protein